MDAPYQRLSATDAGFLALEDDGDHMHVGAVSVFEPLTQALDDDAHLAALRAQLVSVAAAVPRLRQRVARVPGFGNPVWVEAAHLVIEEHVQGARVAAPGDGTRLSELASRIYSSRLDRDRPLWEMWLVHGLADGGFATVFKVHHCLLDGMGGMHLLQALASTGHGTIPQAAARAGRVSQAQLFRGELQHRLRGVARLWEARGGARAASPAASARRTWRGVAGALKTGFSPTSPTPLTPHRISSERVFATLRSELGQLEHIKRKLGGTLNDVVLAVVTGVLRNHLRQQDCDPDRVKRFRALVPANLRKGTSSGGLGNQVTLVMAELPIATADPRERLARIAARTRYLKQSSGQIEGTKWIAELDDALGLGLATTAFKLAVRLRGFDVVISNVPGPRVSLPLFGATLREVYPLVPLFRRQGFGVAVLSYAGHLHWGVHADRAVLADLGPVTRAIEAELHALERLADE